VAALAVAAGGSLATPPIASAQLGAALGRSLGTSDISVQVSGWPPPALWWGRVDVLAVKARHLHMGTLDVESFDATLSHVRFDPAVLYANRPFVILAIGTAVAHVTVTQEALAALLNTQPALRGMTVALQAGRVSLAGNVVALGGAVSATGDGRFVVRGGTAVDLVLDHVALGGIALPAAVSDQVMRSINPVLDLRTLPFDLRLSGVTVGNGTATLDAVGGHG
jgi:hypothetical protein